MIDKKINKNCYIREKVHRNAYAKLKAKPNLGT